MSFVISRQVGKFNRMANKQADAAIGRNLQRIRTEANCTQDELAKEMRSLGYKWSKTTVWSIETGERPLKLSEAQDLLKCLGYDWISYLPILLQGEGIPATELEIKGKLLANRYEATAKMVPELVNAYFDYLISSASAFNKKTDDDEKEKTKDTLDEYCPEALNSFYWGCLKDRFREYCLEHQEQELDLGDDKSDGYNAEWRNTFNLLGNEWRKYLFPDDYYASTDDSAGD